MSTQHAERNVRHIDKKSALMRAGPVSSTNREESRFASLRNIVGLVATGAGIFAALLYLAGRGFASGYFGAMNIPEYEVNFSFQEYGAVSWLPLFMFPVVVVGLSGLLGGILSRILDFMSPLFNRFRDWLHKYVALRLHLPRLPEASQRTKTCFRIASSAYLLFLLFLMLAVTLYIANLYGSWSGKEYVLRNAPLVEIISKTPLPLGAVTVSSDSVAGDQHLYTSLRMLTFNNGTYYLFRGIDAATCKPDRVYVIQARESLQINLLPARMIVGACQ